MTMIMIGMMIYDDDFDSDGNRVNGFTLTVI